ncbi:glycosyltransferase [uncultured Roseobacter sp.]|uniref:glycosyltransferase n=1 Tax=uncultured Roseobacter sp. TaxID=114847 RepID=UPI00262E6299|nr:glycosyltransferase [uncultured Roseobacter sp.]
MNKTDGILLISQWPHVKNGEYELIEKIKKTDMNVRVVDYFGRCVDTGENLNTPLARQRFDYAISFHYDTPILLNVPTFLWVANPVEFMHLRPDYRSKILGNITAPFGYMLNGSDYIADHMSRVAGYDIRAQGLSFYPSCGRDALNVPRDPNKVQGPEIEKVFYCGVNWERGSDKSGRAHGLLARLQESHQAEFFGPETLEGFKTWQDYPSYKGEIPFDGESMFKEMRKYAAVLAISSPAHIKSKTSSSRVFEGTAAGVPIISDRNPHVEKLFGDSVFYFEGKTDSEQAASISDILKLLKENPERGVEAVKSAQKRMREEFCFEAALPATKDFVKHSMIGELPSNHVNTDAESIDVFLFHHDPSFETQASKEPFANSAYIVDTIQYLSARSAAKVCLSVVSDTDLPELESALAGICAVRRIQPGELAPDPWDAMRLGAKVECLRKKSDADTSVYWTQIAQPHFDYLAQSVQWRAASRKKGSDVLHVAGFWTGDPEQQGEKLVPPPIHNEVCGTYQWSDESPAHHELAAMTFGKEVWDRFAFGTLEAFDALLPVAILSILEGHQLPYRRSRKVSLRVQHSSFDLNYEKINRLREDGFWAQHYQIPSNYAHEISALADVTSESHTSFDIWRSVAGQSSEAMLTQSEELKRAIRVITKLRSPVIRFRNFSRKLRGKKVS